MTTDRLRLSAGELLGATERRPRMVMEMTTVAIEQQPAATAATPPAMLILEVRSVTKAFGGNRAVDDCSFSVGRGTITGLIGPNGAGKSTLLNVIAGALQATSGSILLDGEPIDGLRPDAVAAARPRAHLPGPTPDPDDDGAGKPGSGRPGSSGGADLERLVSARAGRATGKRDHRSGARGARLCQSPASARRLRGQSLRRPEEAAGVRADADGHAAPGPPR